MPTAGTGAPVTVTDNAMSKSMKAALLSALVFPGLGHIYLKRYLPGLLLAGIALAALVVVISATLDTALQLSDAILRGDIAPDVTAITESLASQPAGADALRLNGAYAVLAVAWLIGIVDAYRAGRKHAGRRGSRDA